MIFQNINIALRFCHYISFIWRRSTCELTPAWEFFKQAMQGKNTQLTASLLAFLPWTFCILTLRI